MKKYFEFSDDVATANVAYRAYGYSLDEVFLAGNEILIKALADMVTVRSTELEVFTIRQNTLEDLLVD